MGRVPGKGLAKLVTAVERVDAAVHSFGSSKQETWSKWKREDKPAAEPDGPLAAMSQEELHAHHPGEHSHVARTRWRRLSGVVFTFSNRKQQIWERWADEEPVVESGVKKAKEKIAEDLAGHAPEDRFSALKESTWQEWDKLEPLRASQVWDARTHTPDDAKVDRDHLQVLSESATDLDDGAKKSSKPSRAGDERGGLPDLAADDWRRSAYEVRHEGATSVRRGDRAVHGQGGRPVACLICGMSSRDDL